MPNVPPTTKEIAQAAGVCPATVSLALRDQPGVSEATRKRIKSLARKMGYRKDPVVAKLMAQLKRTRRKQPATLAFITDHTQPFKEMQTTKDTRSFEGAQARAAELGYELAEFQVTGDMDGRRLSKILWTRGVDGILVGPLKQGGSRLQLDWSRFPCVAVGHSLREPQIHKASNNQFQSILLALNRIHELGYRRIGVLINRDSDDRVHHAWKAGYLLARDSLGLRYPQDGIIWLDESYDRFARWMEKEEPDIILGSTSFSPIQSWITKLGLRVPDEIGLAMLQLLPRDRNLSGIDQQWREIGAAAVDRLVGLIHSHQKGIPRNPSTLTLDGKWLDGLTTRRINPK